MVGRTISPNMALDQLIARRQACGEDILHLGFGESRLPAPAVLVERLAAGAVSNRYGPVAGSSAVRQAVAGYFIRRRLPTDASQIVVGPGTKPLLMALQMVIPGDTVLPSPCWNTYEPQARLAGKSAIRVPITESYGGVPDPSALREAIRAARALGGDPRIVVLTLPDNPTGTLAPPEAIEQVCAIAEEEDLYIVSDEIYRDTVHDPERDVRSPAEIAPERTVVLSGLSKNLALGGWRIGAVRFPDGAWGTRVRDQVVSFASEVWSTLAGPMQEVAVHAYSEPPEIRARLVTDARLHGAVAREMHRVITEIGALCRPPEAGFYVYPDLAPFKDQLADQGIEDALSLQHHLLDELGIGVLAGVHLGDDGRALRFRAATSMLYGNDADEQQAALDAERPLELPHVREAITRVEDGFRRLTSPRFTPGSAGRRTRMPEEQQRNGSALVFPGMKPTKFADMAKFMLINPLAREMFAEADEVLGYRLFDRYRDAGEDYSEYSQVVFLVSCLALARWSEKELGVVPDTVAGASFGGKAAAVRAGALSFEDAVRITSGISRCEGEYFTGDRADLVTVSFARTPEGRLEEILGDMTEEGTWHEVSCFIDQDFFMVTLDSEHLDLFQKRIRSVGGFPLYVTRPPMHATAFQGLRETVESEVLAAVPFTDPQLPLVTDHDGGIASTGEAVRTALLDGLVRPVRWPYVVDTLKRLGVGKVHVAGPDVLFGRVSVTTRAFDVVTVDPRMSLRPRRRNAA